MKRSFFLFLIAILTFGCVLTNSNKLYTEHVSRKNLNRSIYVDISFSSEEEDMIINALREWECISKGSIKYDIHLKYEDYDYEYLQGNPIIIRKVFSVYPTIAKADMQIRKNNANLIVIGYFDGEIKVDEILIVQDRTSSDTFQSVVTHEIGHSLKLKHANNKNSVMYYANDQGKPHITYSDLVNFCEAYGCDPDSLKVCER